MHALSIKQPWAALLVHGRKTIEVRRWPTARRGPVLIHASRGFDERLEVWAKVPKELLEAARITGGIVGQGEVLQCLAYRSVQAFARDQLLHLNELSWYEPPVLYGFSFGNLMPLPFHPCPGWMRFFEVQLPEKTA